MRIRKTEAWLFIAGIIALAGTWTYTARVLIPYQISDSAAHSRPRGNLSDLYPRWLGARELFLHGRDPYSPEISRQIQAGYYGRPLDPARPTDPKDQQGFVYPLYVVFYLAPTIHAQFSSVQHVFFWILVALTVTSVPVWLGVLRWSPSLWTHLSILAFTLGSLGAMQGIKLQQLTLFVVPLIALAVLLLIKDHQTAAGVLLALATIKPQLVWLLLLCLLIWSAADWRRRWHWLASFLSTMAVLFGASQLVLPGWIPKFLHALAEYRRYTGSMSVVEELIPRPWNWLLELIALVAILLLAWRARPAAAISDDFARMIGAVLAVTVFILPAFAPYNQLLLLPAILLAIRDREVIWHHGLTLRVVFVLTAVLLAWPWVVSIPLAALSYLMSPALLQKYWAVPFWTSLAIPVAVGALMLFYVRRTLFTPLRKQRTA